MAVAIMDLLPSIFLLLDAVFRGNLLIFAGGSALNELKTLLLKDSWSCWQGVLWVRTLTADPRLTGKTASTDIPQLFHIQSAACKRAGAGAQVHPLSSCRLQIRLSFSSGQASPEVKTSTSSFFPSSSAPGRTYLLETVGASLALPLSHKERTNYFQG